MTKKVTFLISVGILFMTSGRSKTSVSADSAPADVRAPSQQPVALAPAWIGTFSYLGMHTGMDKQEATKTLSIFRDMEPKCEVNPKFPELENCRGEEKELTIYLTFMYGRLFSITGEDKYSPFGAFAYPFIAKYGEPLTRTESRLIWAAGTRRLPDGRVDSRETCQVYLDKGNAKVTIWWRDKVLK